MAVKSMSIEYAQRGIVAAVLHPGSVATETRTGGNGLPVDKSVTGMRNVIDGLTAEIRYLLALRWRYDRVVRSARPAMYAAETATQYMC